MLRPEIEALLLEHGPRALPGRPARRRARRQARRRLSAPTPADGKPAAAPDAEAAGRPRRLGPRGPRRRDRPPTSSARVAATRPATLLVNALDAKHRPEMREMEKVLVLQILDSSWMEHLRAMDHLRSSVGLQGYAQIDPKVEYKREGMKIFDEMWNGIADKVTDLIFRVEQFDPEFLSYLGLALAARPGPDDPPVGRLASSAAGAGRRRHPRRSRTRPSPPASNRPRRSASRSATLAKRSAGTTPALRIG